MSRGEIAQRALHFLGAPFRLLWAALTGVADSLQGLPWQAYVYMTAGATRLAEKRCIPVWCR